MEKQVRSVLTGCLLDVSGSMQRSFGSRRATGAARYASKNKWIRSIFQVADKLVEHDVSSTNHVFMAGVGAKENPNIFDILASVRTAQRRKQEYDDRIGPLKQLSLDQVFDQALSILENNGAPRVRKWAKMDVLHRVVDHETACIILDALQTDNEFRRKVAHEFLPIECREFSDGDIKAATPTVAKAAAVGAGLLTIATGGLFGVVFLAGSLAVSVASEIKVEKSRDDSVKEVVEKCKQYLEEKLKNDILVALSQNSVLSAKDAQAILHSCNKEGAAKLTDKRIEELVKAIEPCIYGGTPLMKALRQSNLLFNCDRFHQDFKLLFVLSDGEPSDNVLNKTELVKQLRDLGVTIVSCFITDSNISDPRCLYSSVRYEWEGPAQFMFDISSTVSTQRIPRTLFIRRGWTIETKNNETRLFFQINHPDMIDEVCDIAKSCVCSQDAMSDVLSEVDLDLYINRANDGFEPKLQSKLSCYAVASATVMHLSMLRIVGRDGGYPDFFDVRDKIVSKYGDNRANTVAVLQEVCPEYRLECKEVDESAALEAIIAKRPVVARFWLTRGEWDVLKKFYGENPQGILTRSLIDVASRGDTPGDTETSGHTVVLVSFDRHSLRLMNSWGSSWGDGGFFRVESAEMLGMKFIDVGWSQLSDAEKTAFKEHGPVVAEKLFTSLKGLQACKFECPECHVESLVSEFSGHTLEAKCPRCGQSFNANLSGSDLALNLYLTSLMRK